MNDAPVEIHSVIFRPDGMAEISFAEKAELTPTVSVVKTLLIDRQRFAEEIDDLEIAVFELVDEALLALRNPPDSVPVRKKD